MRETCPSVRLANDLCCRTRPRHRYRKQATTTLSNSTWGGRVQTPSIGCCLQNEFVLTVITNFCGSFTTSVVASGTDLWVYAISLLGCYEVVDALDTPARFRRPI